MSDDDRGGFPGANPDGRGRQRGARPGRVAGCARSVEAAFDPIHGHRLCPQVSRRFTVPTDPTRHLSGTLGEGMTKHHKNQLLLAISPKSRKHGTLPAAPHTVATTKSKAG
jgi:hypothetical protein